MLKQKTGISEKTYSINVYKKTPEEETKEQQEEVQDIKIIEKKHSKNKYLWLIPIGLILAIICGVIIYKRNKL